MSKIGPNPGLPVNFHILQDAIDLFFNSFTLSSHQNLNGKGTAKWSDMHAVHDENSIERTWKTAAADWTLLDRTKSTTCRCECCAAGRWPVEPSRHRVREQHQAASQTLHC